MYYMVYIYIIFYILYIKFYISYIMPRARGKSGVCVCLSTVKTQKKGAHTPSQADSSPFYLSVYNPSLRPWGVSRRCRTIRFSHTIQSWLSESRPFFYSLNCGRHTYICMCVWCIHIYIYIQCMRISHRETPHLDVLESIL